MKKKYSWIEWNCPNCKEEWGWGWTLEDLLQWASEARLKNGKEITEIKCNKCKKVYNFESIKKVAEKF